MAELTQEEELARRMRGSGASLLGSMMSPNAAGKALSMMGGQVSPTEPAQTMPSAQAGVRSVGQAEAAKALDSMGLGSDANYSLRNLTDSVTPGGSVDRDAGSANALSMMDRSKGRSFQDMLPPPQSGISGVSSGLLSGAIGAASQPQAPIQMPQAAGISMEPWMPPPRNDVAAFRAEKYAMGHPELYSSLMRDISQADVANARSSLDAWRSGNELAAGTSNANASNAANALIAGQNRASHAEDLNKQFDAAKALEQMKVDMLDRQHKMQFEHKGEADEHQAVQNAATIYAHELSRKPTPEDPTGGTPQSAAAVRDSYLQQLVRDSAGKKINTGSSPSQATGSEAPATAGLTKSQLQEQARRDVLRSRMVKDDNGKAVLDPNAPINPIELSNILKEPSYQQDPEKIKSLVQVLQESPGFNDFYKKSHEQLGESLYHSGQSSVGGFNIKDAPAKYGISQFLPAGTARFFQSINNINPVAKVMDAIEGQDSSPRSNMTDSEGNTFNFRSPGKIASPFLDTVAPKENADKLAFLLNEIRKYKK